MFDSIDDAAGRLAGTGYIADRETATSVYLAAKLGKPLFVEGQRGVGKTALAEAIAASLDLEPVRLRCYAGMDGVHAAYRWDYAGQVLRMRQAREEGESAAAVERTLRSEEYLVKGPLLEAFSRPRALLLVDVIDRAGAAFAAYLEAVLDSGSVQVPGLGAFDTESPPLVVMTSNQRRQEHDGLRRRSLYVWLDYPEFEREVDIAMARVPGLGRALAGEVCNLVMAIREEDFREKPGLAESIDWCRALVALHRTGLDAAVVDETLGCILKSPQDIARFRKEQYFERVAARRVDISG